MVHISEFTADLIKHGKVKFDKSRNSHEKATFHDSCNPARAMGLLDEPRYVLDHVVDNWVEMPRNTIREQTFCCGSGTALNTDEIMELRMRSGFPRANAVQYVQQKHDVNTLGTVCAIDRATLTTLVEYWVPEVQVAGISELVGNALIVEGEQRQELDEGLRTLV
jgi:Fe-S oxidoreductase